MRVELSHLSMAFDGTEVLHDITFDEEVSALAIIGPSGGGKSTLLRIIGGLLVPTGGTLAVDGVPVPTGEAALRDYRATLGFVFQDGGLFHHLTAQENVALPLRVVHGVEDAEASDRAHDLLERLGFLSFQAWRDRHLAFFPFEQQQNQYHPEQYCHRVELSSNHPDVLPVVLSVSLCEEQQMQ